jgi:ATP-dependent Clp protease ATP-binding subunit ClpC
MQATGATISAAYLRHRYSGDEGEGRQREMFERFTKRARLVVVQAQQEARRLDHDYVGTEHLLLGLTGVGEGLAVKVLESLGIALDAIRQRVEESVDRGEQAPSGHIRFTSQAKTVLELSLRESRARNDLYIGTEHILLGLIREGDGVAAHVLLELGADLESTREQVTRLLEERWRQHGNQAG